MSSVQFRFGGNYQSLDRGVGCTHSKRQVDLCDLLGYRIQPVKLRQYVNRPLAFFFFFFFQRIFFFLFQTDCVCRWTHSIAGRRPSRRSEPHLPKESRVIISVKERALRLWSVRLMGYRLCEGNRSCYSFSFPPFYYYNPERRERDTTWSGGKIRSRDVIAIGQWHHMHGVGV